MAVSLSMWQLIQGHNELSYYKLGFIKQGTETPFFGLSEPMSAERYQVR